VEVGACAQSHSAPPEPATANPSAAAASVAQTPAPSSSALWFERGPEQAWPKLQLQLRGGGAAEWSLTIETPERVQREERRLVCPERWEKHCWQAAIETGRVPPAALDELFATLGSSADWQATGPQPPGQAQLVLELERDGARSRPMSVAPTAEGAKIRRAAEKVRAAFVADR
ncbi:MAG TPA: hypothetical protein VEQ59_02090, partial [Polyangiaceae bacterium]|nr:hypothetical protein [Polyangiaceae bacterium]